MGPVGVDVEGGARGFVSRPRIISGAAVPRHRGLAVRTLVRGTWKTGEEVLNHSSGWPDLADILGTILAHTHTWAFAFTHAPHTHTHKHAHGPTLMHMGTHSHTHTHTHKHGHTLTCMGTHTHTHPNTQLWAHTLN